MYKRSSLFWGTVLIILAALLLLKQLQIINDVFGFFWPLAVIAFGIWLILSFFTRHQPEEGQRVSIPLEGATSAFIKLDYGAGRLTLHSDTEASEVLSGCFIGGLDFKSHMDGSRLEVKLRSPNHFWTWGVDETPNWDLRLNPNIPISLEYDCGAASSILDLGNLKVTNLDIDTGASSTELTLPGNAGNTHVDIDTGASSLKIIIPSGVAASIRVKRGITSTKIDNRFPRIDTGFYQSRDYSTASNRVDLTIDAGVGSIDIV